jgi:hypothetical protein
MNLGMMAQQMTRQQVAATMDRIDLQIMEGYSIFYENLDPRVPTL